MKPQFIKDFTPQFFISMKTYNKDKFTNDLLAGLNVGIVALPLAIAFAIASGVSPEKGIYTSIIAGIIISLLGGCTVQIGGATGAFSIIVSDIVLHYGFTGVVIATFMAGLMLILMGALKLGSIIKFMPYPIIVGFTSGIAMLIFSSQVKDFLGLKIDQLPSDFITKFSVYCQNISSIEWLTLLVGIISLFIIVGVARVTKRISGALVAIIIISIAVMILKHFTGITSIETIGDRFSINSSLPTVKMVSLNIESIRLLFPSAFTIAILGAIQSLLSAKVADGVTGHHSNSNMELVAQGVANIFSPLFGGIPATGAIARTMTNINNGGTTPVAGIVHSLFLAFVVLFLSKLISFIPMACLAAILIVVSYNMSEWRNFVGLLKGARPDAAVLVVTFLLTVILDLTIAIEVGLLLAVFLSIKRISETTTISVIEKELDLNDDGELGYDNEILEIPNGVEVYEIEGPLFFGIANKFDEAMREVGDKPLIRIIRMRRIPYIDSTGLHNLETLCIKSRKEGIHIILSGVRPQIRQELNNAHFPELIGTENICDNINHALERTYVLLSELDADTED